MVTPPFRLLVVSLTSLALRCRLGEEESIPLLWVISRRSVYLAERLLSGAYQPLKVNIEKTTNLSVCFHQ